MRLRAVARLAPKRNRSRLRMSDLTENDWDCDGRPCFGCAANSMQAMLRRALDEIDAGQGLVSASTWGTLLCVAESLGEFGEGK